MKPAYRSLRFEAFGRMQCMCCRANESLGFWQVPLIMGLIKIERHHLNSGGYAGQKRLGDEYTIPLCSWHHRGVIRPQWTRITMIASYGPSLAGGSKPFRETYGTDAELLAKTNLLLDAILRLEKAA